MEPFIDREQFSMRITYYQDEDFCFQYSICEGVLFLHADVFNSKLSAFKRGFSVFREFLLDVQKQGMSEVYSITPNPKFCQLLGGVSMKEIEIEDRKYEVYKWDLKRLL